MTVDINLSFQTEMVVWRMAILGGIRERGYRSCSFLSLYRIHGIDVKMLAIQLDRTALKEDFQK